MRRFLHGATDTSTLPGFPGDFNDDWRHYILSKFGEINIENLSDAEHHAMALNYVSRIAEGLADFDNHILSISHYEAIAWVGLVETEAWNNLSSTERSQLGASYQNALDGRSLECN